VAIFIYKGCGGWFLIQLSQDAILPWRSGAILRVLSKQTGSEFKHIIHSYGIVEGRRLDRDHVLNLATCVLSSQ